MAALEPNCFEPERVPDENQTSDHDNDESERLNNLNWYNCGRCEFRKTARVHLLSRRARIGKQVYGKVCVFFELFTFLPFNLHATRNQLPNFHF